MTRARPVPLSDPALGADGYYYTPARRFICAQCLTPIGRGALVLRLTAPPHLRGPYHPACGTDLLTAPTTHESED